MVTDIITVGILTFVAISDVALLLLKLPTFSKRFRVWGKQLASPTYVWGVLGGHFWGPVGFNPLGGWVSSITVLIASVIMVAIIHRRIIHEWPEMPLWLILFYIPIGIAPGAFLWPQ